MTGGSIFEVLSDDTAIADWADKLIAYAALPSLRGYVLPEQTATLFRRDPVVSGLPPPEPAGRSLCRAWTSACR
jgi:hypothetical protein